MRGPDRQGRNLMGPLGGSVLIRQPEGEKEEKEREMYRGREGSGRG